MHGIIIEVSPVHRNSTLAHVRNCVAINERLRWDMAWDENKIKSAAKKQYDRYLFSYSAKFAPHDAMARFVESQPNARRFWMMNEYNGSVPKCLRDAGDVTVLAGFERLPSRDYRYVRDWHAIDLNLILIGDRFETAKKYGCIYYGTYRPGREADFVNYLKPGIALSSSTKNHKLFRSIGCTSRMVDKISWINRRETLRLFRYSLIIEDEYSHKNYTHLPNRFYEAWWCGCIPLIDEQCRVSVQRSGYDVPEFCFVTPDTISERISELDVDYANKQLELDRRVSDEIMSRHENIMAQIVSILTGD